MYIFFEKSESLFLSESKFKSVFESRSLLTPLDSPKGVSFSSMDARLLRSLDWWYFLDSIVEKRVMFLMDSGL